MNSSKNWILFLVVSSILSLTAFTPLAQNIDASPPDEPVKLIFIHHSCGENWLSDGYGNLGRELGENNYFVSDTNYGWGPDYIGDRTDIPNWMEWFRSEQTGIITEALYNENDQMSGYTRTLSDPGGENAIIMFKSCYPNSELSGNPNDPPGTSADLTVSGAKFVYNEILKYFAARPDKLFIVITAPPVSSRANAKNARAFNNWLVEDWLEENGYTLPNVAVFDFYNVLTGKNAHHRYQNGQITHVTTNSDTLAYPSGDDHPSEAGSRKATEEFIPLLNIYTQRWQASDPQPVTISSETGEVSTVEIEPGEIGSAGSDTAGTALDGGLIDNFENDNPPGINGWEAFIGDPNSTSMQCTAVGGEAFAGERSLVVDFDVAANDWATCALMYDSGQDWSAGEGITFMLRASQPGLVFDVDLHSGGSDALQTYHFTIETTAESAEGWIPISLRWEDLTRVDWEENAGSPFSNPENVSGMAFGVSTYADTNNTGTIWVDEIALLGENSAIADHSAAEPGELITPESGDTRRGFNLPCGMALILPVMLVGGGVWQRKEQIGG